MRDGLTINVDKDRLMLALEQNRSKHGAAYEKAKAGYIKVTTEQVKAYLTRLTNGELLERAFLPAPPEDHTGDYDDAIEMMAWAQDQFIELTQAQFKQYVMDDWGWKDQWLMSNTAYLEA
jgi:hypothetical protein